MLHVFYSEESTTQSWLYEAALFHLCFFFLSNLFAIWRSINTPLNSIVQRLHPKQPLKRLRWATKITLDVSKLENEHAFVCPPSVRPGTAGVGQKLEASQGDWWISPVLIRMHGSVSSKTLLFLMITGPMHCLRRWQVYFPLIYSFVEFKEILYLLL